MRTAVAVIFREGSDKPDLSHGPASEIKDLFDKTVRAGSFKEAQLWTSGGGMVKRRRPEKPKGEAPSENRKFSDKPEPESPADKPQPGDKPKTEAPAPKTKPSNKKK